MLGMDSIGFSDHAPLPFPTSWAMKEDGIGDYLKEVVDAKIKFDKSLKVYCGFEADYIKGGVTPDRWRVLPGLDYMIGSIHFLLMPDGQLLEVTGDRQNFELIRNQNNLEDKELMLLYFQANADMLDDANVDVLGHLDKMKINIPNFNEILASDKDVQKALDSVLHLCDREDVVIEVNTRGQYKSNSKETYPGPYILNRILEEELNICISSDAHGVKESRMLFDETKEMLKSTGHKYNFTFDGYDWVPEEL